MYDITYTPVSKRQNYGERTRLRVSDFRGRKIPIRDTGSLESKKALVQRQKTLRQPNEPRWIT